MSHLLDSKAYPMDRQTYIRDVAHLLEFTVVPGLSRFWRAKDLETAYHWLRHTDADLTNDQQQALAILRRLLNDTPPATPRDGDGGAREG